LDGGFEEMRMKNGTKLEHYEILSPIGAGGMGEVYRARDARLDRDVAIKVLPGDLAKDADRLRRFEQEARATSALNHPNILTIYDIGTHDGAPFIVAELLNGAELRAQLDEGTLPVRQAIEYAQQIAAGLAAAHEKGIVHRDLKPENLFVTSDGRVKILDFGLAKLKPQKLAGSVNTDAPTRVPQTDPGTVMGTVGYMSPEQVRGQEADHRADIFSFGAILYEMITGRRAFWRETTAETMTAILKEEPEELSASNPNINPALDKIVRRCLEKKPERRFQSTSDLGFALEALSLPSGSNQTLALKALPEKEAAKSSASLFRRAGLGWLVAAVAMLAALLLAWLHFLPSSPPAPLTRFSISLPKGTNTGGEAAPVISLSPDGRRLVFSAEDTGGKRRLWLRPLDALAAQPLTGTEGAVYCFWSPDGRYLAFFADNKLKKLDLGSGVVETICQTDRGAGRGGDWNRQGVILFNSGNETGLSRVNAAGGKPEAVSELDASRGERMHLFPSFLPDGKHFLFENTGGDNRGIYVGSLDSKERKLLIPLGTDVANSTQSVWAPPGFILYALNRNTLLAQAFDPDRLELKGEPFRVAENVLYTVNLKARFTVSANGVLAFVQGGEADTVQLTWRDRFGKQVGIAGPPDLWTSFKLSPDERSAALSREEPNRLHTLWMLDLLKGTTSRFVADGDNFSPVWSPDGKQLVYTSVRNGLIFFLRPVAGNGQEEPVFVVQRGGYYPSSWSPDGKYLIFRASVPETGLDLWLLPFSDRKPQPLFQTKFNEQNAKISPDGNWLAYQSDESGNNEVYVTQFPMNQSGLQPARSWRISTSGGVNPSWRGDGKELYFVSGNKLMAVKVSGGTEFQAGPPQSLFEIEGTNYAPGKDGQRFLVSVVTEKATAPPINVVLNWTAEIKK
jgi:serine/threonine protein kinase/Tol biopolymer transport system component